jgi:hypothetical protein
VVALPSRHSDVVGYVGSVEHMTLEELLNKLFVAIDTRVFLSSLYALNQFVNQSACVHFCLLFDEWPNLTSKNRLTGTAPRDEVGVLWICVSPLSSSGRTMLPGQPFGIVIW